MFDSAIASLRESTHAATAIIVLIVVVSLLLLVMLGLLGAVRRQRLRLTALTRGESEGSLEDVLASHLEIVAQSTRRMDSLEQAVGVLQAQIPGCLQKVGLVRYDAFEDVGGEQSFSVALLNGQGEGIVLTSVYSRQDIRVYAKSIANGRGSHALSKEEMQAIKACTS